MTSHPNIFFFFFLVGRPYSITTARSLGAYKMIVVQETNAVYSVDAVNYLPHNSGLGF